MDALLIVAGFALLVGLLWARHRGLFSAHSLYVLFILALPLTVLARFDIRFSVMLGGRPFWALFGAMALAGVAGAAWVLARGRPLRAKGLGSLLGLAGPFLAVIVAEALVLWACGRRPHSLWKGGWPTAQALVLFALPLLAGGGVMLAARFEDDGIERYLIAFGVFTLAVAAVNLLTAFARTRILPLVLTRAETGDAPFTGFGRSFSPLGHPIANAVVLYMGATLALSRALAARKRQIFYVLASAAAAAGIIVSLSRSVVLVWALTVLWQLRPAGKALRRLALAALLAAVIVIMATSFDLSRLTFTRDRSLDMRRSSLWTGLRLLSERPVLGWGFGQAYDSIWHRGSDEAMRGDGPMTMIRGMWTGREPHNTYLMVLVETGLVGFAAFVWLLWGVWRLLSPPPGVHDPARLALLAGFRVMYVGFLALSLAVSHVMFHHRVALVLWTFIAAGVAYRSHLAGDAAARPVAAPAKAGPPLGQPPRVGGSE